MSRISEQQFIEAWKRLGSPTLVSRELKIPIRKVYERRNYLQSKHGISLETWNDTSARAGHKKHEGRIEMSMENSIGVVFSDAHFWPGFKTTANRALLKLLPDLKPSFVCCNGDAFDGATNSRHPRIGWDKRPTLIEELKTCQNRLGEIREAAGTRNTVWCLGNHDARFETHLAAVAPQYEGITGLHLKDHFPDWSPSWSLWINGDVCIKHRWKNGVHATHNNTVGSGVTMITGHLHSLKVTPYTDYRGTRYGVDTGTLADPDGPQFLDYTEDGPKNWRSGFIVLTWHKGQLLCPEMVQVIDEGMVQFRGQVIEV